MTILIILIMPRDLSRPIRIRLSSDALNSVPHTTALSLLFVVVFEGDWVTRASCLILGAAAHPVDRLHVGG